jgi:hypothetical protein
MKIPEISANGARRAFVTARGVRSFVNDRHHEKRTAMDE